MLDKGPARGVKRPTQFVDIKAMRRSGTGGYAVSGEAYRGKVPKLVIHDDDYRAVARSKCIAQVTRIGPNCFRYHRGKDSGIATSLADAFLLVGFELISNDDNTLSLKRLEVPTEHPSRCDLVVEDDQVAVDPSPE